MRKLLCLPALMFISLFIGTTVSAVEGRIYGCSVKTFQQLNENGLLAVTPLTKSIMKLNPKFIFDEASGLLRHPFGNNPISMKILNKGDNQNSGVGIVIRTGVDVFRVQTWKTNMPFVYTESIGVYTGLCEPL